MILLGSYEAFEGLQNFDSRFNKIFRVRADFDDEVEHTPDAEDLYARFIARVCREEALLPFNRGGVAAVVEFGQKHVADQRKLTLQFGRLVAVLKEADYWARRQRARLVSERHVVRAFQEHRFRYSLYEQKVHESYRDGSILIDVTGAVIGQVNGLAVYQIGDYAFGRPVRITAATFMGRPGVINIEREAELSGSTHDKGVLILSGYLGSVFAQRHPLNLAISIAFEQSYNEIDGDSASSAELYAILSSLSGIPIRQGIAVTGSVNQTGSDPGHRRGQPEDRRVLRGLPREGLDGRAGSDHAYGQRPQPDAAPGRGRCRPEEAVPCLPGVDRGGGDRDPDRRAGRTTGRRGPIRPRDRLRRGSEKAENLRRAGPPGEAGRKRRRRLTTEKIA